MKLSAIYSWGTSAPPVISFAYPFQDIIFCPPTSPRNESRIKNAVAWALFIRYAFTTAIPDQAVYHICGNPERLSASPYVPIGLMTRLVCLELPI